MKKTQKYFYLAVIIQLFYMVNQILCRDFYKILGIQRQASDDEIRRAFKKLSIKYHPGNNN